jgi:hypothetical protein
MSKAERAGLFRRRDEWLKWIATVLETENGRQLAREVDVCPHTALALATVVGNSGPSFTKQGIFASQETLAAKLAQQLVRDKANVRLVRRATKLLVKVGALRVEARSGNTNLLVPLLEGNRLHDAVETMKERGDGGVRTPGRQRPLNPGRHRPRTPDASVLQVFL